MGGAATAPLTWPTVRGGSDTNGRSVRHDPFDQGPLDPDRGTTIDPRCDRWGLRPIAREPRRTLRRGPPSLDERAGDEAWGRQDELCPESDGIVRSRLGRSGVARSRSATSLSAWRSGLPTGHLEKRIESHLIALHCLRASAVSRSADYRLDILRISLLSIWGEAKCALV